MEEDSELVIARSVGYLFLALWAVMYVTLVVGLHLRRSSRFVYMVHPHNILFQYATVISLGIVMIAALHLQALMACQTLSFVFCLLLPFWSFPSMWSNFLIYYDCKRHNYKARLASLRDHVHNVNSDSPRLSQSSDRPFIPTETFDLEANHDLLKTESAEFYLKRNLTRLKYKIIPTVILCALHLAVYLGMHFTLGFGLPEGEITVSEAIPICLRNYRYAFVAGCGVYMVGLVGTGLLLTRVYEPVYRKRASRTIVLGGLPVFAIIIIVTVDPTLFPFPYADIVAIWCSMTFGMLNTGIMPILNSFPAWRRVMCCEKPINPAVFGDSILGTEHSIEAEEGGVTPVQLVSDSEYVPGTIQSIRAKKNQTLPVFEMTKGGKSSSLTPETLLGMLQRSDALSKSFLEYLKQHWCQEIYMFYVDADLFLWHTYRSDSQRADYAKFIYKRYISSTAPFEINISSRTKQQIAAAIERGDITKNLFDDAKEDMRRCLVHEHLPVWASSEEGYQAIKIYMHQSRHQHLRSDRAAS